MENDSQNAPISPQIAPVTQTTIPMVNSTVAPQNTQNSTTTEDRIDLWCAYAQLREGWFPGSLSYVNNNPGNLKFVGQPLALNTGPKDGSELCKFANYGDGYKTLYDMFLDDCSGKSEVHPATETVTEYYQGIMVKGVYVNGYAPSSDNNDPISYAAGAAGAMNVSTNTQLKDLL